MTKVPTNGDLVKEGLKCLFALTIGIEEVEKSAKGGDNASHQPR